jgi:hypothetical protein
VGAGTGGEDDALVSQTAEDARDIWIKLDRCSVHVDDIGPGTAQWASNVGVNP